jgi:hypothetical protein
MATCWGPRELLPLRAVLRLAGISSSRLSSWTAAEADCLAADPASCPRRAPNQLTADEVITIHQMVTSTEYRHVPTMFLNTLDSVAALRRHVAFHVVAHDTQVPLSAFRGQTPDEMYFGTGEQVPAELASAKSAALDARLHANRLLS